MTRTARRAQHPIICGTDFTEQARQAANVAAGIARAMQQPLLLIHVSPAAATGVSVTGATRLATAALRKEAARLRARGAQVSVQLHRGHADEVLTAKARQEHASLLVLGALGSRQPTQRFLGSIAERTAEMAQVPTLVVRNDVPFEHWFGGSRPLRVFLGFDFTVTAEAAVDWVRGLAPVGRREVTVGHLNWPPEDQRRFGILDRAPAQGNTPRLQELLERQVGDRVRATLGDEGVEIRVQPSWGRVDLALVGMAVDAGADLIVVGTHQRHGLARLWSGSVSRGVLSEAPASVAVVPVVPSLEQGSPIPEVSRVLVATDMRGNCQRVVAYACGIARPGGVVRIVHVVHPRAIAGGAYETSLRRHDRHLQHVRAVGRRLEALRPPTAQTHALETEAAVVECEDTVQGICQDAARFDADVIVVGTKGVGVRAALLGSVAEGVLAKSRRPVLVVNPPKP